MSAAVNGKLHFHLSCDKHHNRVEDNKKTLKFGKLPGVSITIGFVAVKLI